MGSSLSSSSLRSEHQAFLLIMVLATAVRIWGIGTKSLWYDETFSVVAAARGFGEVFTFTRLSDSHPPLYYLLLNLIIPVWFNEVAVRSISCLAGIATVWLTYVFAKRLLDAKAAVVAATLLAVSPAHIMVSQEARSYALLTFLSLASWYQLIRARAEAGFSCWGLYSILSVLALYTNYLFGVVMVSQAVYVLSTRPPRPYVWNWLLSLAVITALFAPWGPVVVDQILSGRVYPEWRPPFSLTSFAEVGAIFSWGVDCTGRHPSSLA